jgi:hypothetical protein
VDEKAPKPDLAARLLDAVLRCLSVEEATALEPILKSGRLEPLLRTLRTLAGDIEAVMSPPAAAPEPQRLPDVGGAGPDENLRQWLDREREPTNVH